jgi:hypothetical protein
MGRQIYGTHMVEEDERPNHAPPHEWEHATDFEASEILAPRGDYQIQHQTLQSKAQTPTQLGWLALRRAEMWLQGTMGTIEMRG